MTPEGKVRTHLRKRAIGAKAEHRKLGWIGRRNAPDELIFWNVPDGHPPIAALVECKAPGEEPTEAQLREHVRLRAGGFRVEVVDSEESADLLVALLAADARSAWMTELAKDLAEEIFG